jgi:hypothetical protein
MKSKIYLLAPLLIGTTFLLTNCSKQLDRAKRIKTVGGNVDYAVFRCSKAALVGLRKPISILLLGAISFTTGSERCKFRWW